jgi:hypothetical protein
LLAFPVEAAALGAYRRFGNLVKYFKWVDLCQCNANPNVCIGASFANGSFSGFGCASGNESVGNYITIDADCNSPGVYFYNWQGVPSAGTIDLWNVSGPALLATATGVTTPASTHGYQVWDAGTVTLTAGMQVACSLRKVNLSCYPGNTTVPPWPTLNPFGHVTGGYYNPAGFGFPANASGALAGVHPELCGAGSPTIPPDPTPAPKPTGYPTAPTIGPCTSFGDICGVLQTLVYRLDNLWAEVKTIQRYRVPFDTVPSTLHTGITGTGSLALPGLVGLRITITTDVAGTQLQGNPPYLWDRGWLTVNDASGMLEEKRLTRTGYDWFPEKMPLATSLKWSLTPGVVLSVQELQPVP